MSSVAGLLRSRSVPRVFALAVVAVGAVACSSESTRFNNPFSSQSGQPEATGSVQQQRAPAGQVQTSSLPPPTGSHQAPMSGGTSGGGRGLASYQPNQGYDPGATGTVQSQPPAQRPTYGQPPAQQAYNRPPVAPPASRPAPAPKAAAAPAPSSIHVVAPGESLIRIARQHNMTLVELARLNNIPPHTKVNIGDRLTVPAGRSTRAARPEDQRLAASKAPSPLAKANSAATKASSAAKSQPKAAVSQNSSTETVAVVTPAADPATPATPDAVRSGNAGMAFRWPAKGRIIAGFGPRTNGQTNDGINIALPEGTPVHAAGDGTVAYAGNELKGYGNLVLVRHAEGYVTAYAHVRELLVKRGDPIRRGQTIAKSGQTGNVDAPQLHFEVRKGPAPIDPMPMLSGG